MNERVHIVARYGKNIPSERCPSFLLAVLFHDILGISGDLQTVTVYDRAEVVQLVVSCRHRALPDRAFCQLAVTHNGVNTVIFFIHFSCQRHSHTDRKPVAERTGVHLDARQFIVRMADVRAAEFGEFFNDLFHREEPLCRKYCIICLNGMTFTHHKAVAVRVVHVLRADVHLFKIQRYKHIDDTHVAADVAALAGNYHFHYFLPQIIRQTTQFLVFTHDFHSPLKYALTSSSIGSYKSGAMPMYLHASYRTGTTFSWIPTQWWMYGPSTIFASRRFRFCTSTHT